MTGSPAEDAEAAARAAATFSLYDSEIAKDPHALYARLRRACPVAHSDQDQAGEGFWVVTRYDDVVAATLDPETFSSKTVIIPRGQLPDRPPLTADGERHSAFRRVLQPFFTAPQVKKWEPHVRAECRELITRFRERGTCDLTDEYAKKIPLDFTCRFLGISSEHEAKFNEWIHTMFSAMSEPEEKGRAFAEMADFIAGVVQDHRENPTDDFVSVLVDCEIEGKKLDDDQLRELIALILFAGLDTTWSALSSALWHLASHPQDRRRLVEDPDLIPTAVEELLRFYAPVALSRETTREAKINGVTIGAGELVLMSWPSANRDEDQFPDADRVVIDRQVNRHIAFGVGPHRCLGHLAARLEIQVAIEELLKEIPDFELTDPDAVTWTTGPAWGPEHLAVRFPPAAQV